MESKKIDVSVVILNWNGYELIKKYYQSLIDQKFDKFEIVFVDNSSTDNSLELAKKINKNKIDTQYVINDKNYGTAEASNIGAKYCSGKYIFFLSNDMIFSANLIGELYDFMEKNKDIGIASVKMLKNIDDKKSNIIDSRGAKIDFMAVPDSISINCDITKIKDLTQEVFFVFGGALFIRRDLFEKIDGYDERYFTLVDDIDICWRAKLLGYKVYYLNKEYIYHRVSATLSKSHNRKEKRFFSERNGLCSMIKNYKLNTLILTLPLYLLINLLEFLFFIILLKPQMSYVSIRSIIWNIKNLKNTLEKRKKIQSLRNTQDAQIFKMMYSYPMKLWYGYSFLFKRHLWSNYFGNQK